jgi:solute carrier family 25 citrate transporter 1
MGGPPSADSTPLMTFAKGIITGTLEAAICYPTELVKTQLQLQSKVGSRTTHNARASAAARVSKTTHKALTHTLQQIIASQQQSNPQYSGMLDCAKKTVSRNGFMGLYRGAMPLVVGSSGKQAARWTAYTETSKLFRREDGTIALPANMFSGFCAGMSEAIFAVTIIETIKTRVTDDMHRGTKKYSGSLDACIKILRSEGPGGLYRGLVPTIAKQGTNQMVRFPFQQFYVHTITGGDEEKKKNPLYHGLAGGMAGATSVLVTMPQDTLKTRMQGEEAKALYKNTLDCARQIIKNEGFMFFYSGTWPRLVRVSLDVGITFTIMPWLSQLEIFKK